MPKTSKQNYPVAIRSGRHLDRASHWVRITAAHACFQIAGPILIAALFLVLFLGAGCSTAPPAFRSQCPPPDAADYYFPQGAVDPMRPKIDGMLREWYSKYLRAAG